MMTTATVSKEAGSQQVRPAIITQDYTLKAAYDNFKAVGFAKGSDINALIQKGELTYPVRGDEFMIKCAPGKKLGARVESDGFTYDVPDIAVEIAEKKQKLRELANVAIVLSFSQLTMEDGIIKGDIMKVQAVPEKDGWYKVDADTAIPLAGMESTSSDPDARYWYGRDTEPFIGAVVRGGNWNVGGRGRGVVAGCWPDNACGVALANQAQAEPKPEGPVRLRTFDEVVAERTLTILLRQADEAERSVDTLRVSNGPELLAPIETMIATVRQLRIKE
jgi:hypothetical protein